MEESFTVYVVLKSFDVTILWNYIGTTVCKKENSLYLVGRRVFNEHIEPHFETIPEICGVFRVEIFYCFEHVFFVLRGEVGESVFDSGVSGEKNPIFF